MQGLAVGEHDHGHQGHHRQGDRQRPDQGGTAGEHQHRQGLVGGVGHRGQGVGGQHRHRLGVGQLFVLAGAGGQRLAQEPFTQITPNASGTHCSGEITGSAGMDSPLAEFVGKLVQPGRRGWSGWLGTRKCRPVAGAAAEAGSRFTCGRPGGTGRPGLGRPVNNDQAKLRPGLWSDLRRRG